MLTTFTRMTEACLGALPLYVIIRSVALINTLTRSTSYPNHPCAAPDKATGFPHRNGMSLYRGSFSSAPMLERVSDGSSGLLRVSILAGIRI